MKFSLVLTNWGHLRGHGRLEWGHLVPSFPTVPQVQHVLVSGH